MNVQCNEVSERTIKHDNRAGIFVYFLANNCLKHLISTYLSTRQTEQVIDETTHVIKCRIDVKKSPFRAVRDEDVHDEEWRLACCPRPSLPASVTRQRIPPPRAQPLQTAALIDQRADWSAVSDRLWSAVIPGLLSRVCCPGSSSLFPVVYAPRHEEESQPSISHVVNRK